VKPLEIIAAKANPEGRAIPQKLLGELLVQKVLIGDDEVFDFGPVVFTVGTDPNRPLVHLYSAGAGTGLLAAVAQFHRTVWRQTKHTYLLTLVENEAIMKLAKRFGWTAIRRLETGYTLFHLERPK
jgi:hypothetical protein